MFNETKKFFHSLHACSVISDSFATPWTIACQAPLSMRFPRQEYWSGLPFPSPGDLRDPEIEPGSSTSLLHWQVDSCHHKPFTKSLDRLLNLVALFFEFRICQRHLFQ